MTRPGDPPPTLVDYLPADTVMFLDESHVLIGQLGGMFNGDRARKTVLVQYGFRLPSALDNRPLKFEEFEGKMRQVVFVSATPAEYERQHAGQVVEQSPVDDFFGRPRHPYSIGLLDSMPQSVAKGERLRMIAGTVPVPLSVYACGYDARSTPSGAPAVPPTRLAAIGSPTLESIKQ